MAEEPAEEVKAAPDLDPSSGGVNFQIDATRGTMIRGPRRTSQQQPIERVRSPAASRRARTSPGEPMFKLQRLAGNQATARWIQAKLAVGRSDDRFEREADRVAEAVVGRGVPRKPCHACAAGATSCDKCKETGYASVSLSGSSPLSAETAQFFEARMGASFEDVRVHTGPAASASARAIGALAYTAGRDIVFAAGQYAPSTVAGQRLLAHELTHVIQQRGLSSPTGTPIVQRQPDPAGVIILPEMTIIGTRPPSSWPTQDERMLEGCKGKARYEGIHTPGHMWGDYPKNMTKDGWEFWYRISKSDGGFTEFWTNTLNPDDCLWESVEIPGRAVEPGSSTAGREVRPTDKPGEDPVALQEKLIGRLRSIVATRKADLDELETLAKLMNSKDPNVAAEAQVDWDERVSEFSSFDEDYALVSELRKQVDAAHLEAFEDLVEQLVNQRDRWDPEDTYP